MQGTGHVGSGAGVFQNCGCRRDWCAGEMGGGGVADQACGLSTPEILQPLANAAQWLLCWGLWDGIREAVMELSVDVCVVVRVEEEEKPGLRGWLQKWWGAQDGPQHGVMPVSGYAIMLSWQVSRQGTQRRVAQESYK